MKKLWSLCMLCMILLCLTGCEEESKPHEHDFAIEISRTNSTCTTLGSHVLKCRGCEETKEEPLPYAKHTYGEYTITKQPTIDERGEREATCRVCGYVLKESMSTLGYSWYTPVDIDTKTFYNEVCNGKFSRYEGLWVRLSGKVTEISNYSDMKGYYIYGKKGQGVVGWVYSWQSNQLLAKVGDEVTIIGKVENEGDRQVELVECRFE